VLGFADDQGNARVYVLQQCVMRVAGVLSDRGHTELPGTLPETQCDGQGCAKYNFVFLFFCGYGVVCGTFLYLTNILFLIYILRA